MTPSWRERNTYEKAVLVFQVLVAVVLVICLISGRIFHNDTDWMYLIFAIEGALEATVEWKYNRKAAIISILVFVSFLAVFLQSVL